MTLSKKKKEEPLKIWLLSEIEQDYELLINGELVSLNQKETFTKFKNCLEYYVGLEDYAKASKLRDAQNRYLKQLGQKVKESKNLIRR